MATHQPHGAPKPGEAGSLDWPSWDLTALQLADLELVLTGAYAPLTGFMTRAEFEGAHASMRLPSGRPFPVPVVLGVPDEVAESAARHRRLVLRDPEGVGIGVLHVEEVWAVGSSPKVAGAVERVRLPEHHDFPALRLTPAQVRAMARERGWRRMAALATRSSLPPSDIDAMARAAREIDAGLVVMALMDPASPADADVHARVRSIERLTSERAALLWQLAVPAQDDAVRELCVGALVAANAGCTHFILPGERLQGHAEALLAKFAVQAGIELLRVPLHGAGERLAGPGGAPGLRGVTVFFTGLSGSGKSTIANALRVRLLERGRQVTLLDGDIVRKHLSSGLGFSRADREVNIRRIAFVAAEVTKHGGIAICAPIAPYESTRQEARRSIETHGGFVLVHVDTPLEVCEQRDRKGLYARARAGLIEEFTGVSDVYEPPADAEITLRTAHVQPAEAADRILVYLEQHGYLLPERR